MKHSPAKTGTTMMAGFAAAVLIVFSGPASAQNIEESSAQYDAEDAVHYMNKGYSELGKVSAKLNEGNQKSAMKHFNKALKDFNKAVIYYAKANLPASDKPAIEALKKGLEAMQKSVEAMEKGDNTTAQSQYDAAQNYFEQAANLLD